MNRLPRGLRLVAVTCAFLLGAAVTATTYSQREPTEMLFAAAHAFLGTVTDVVVSDEDGTPWTTVTFDVERVLVRGGRSASGASVGVADGAANGGANDATDDAQDENPNDDQGAEPDAAAGDAERIALAFLGGGVPGGSRLTVAGSPRWEVGDRVLVFAYDDVGLASPLVGVRQGVWRVGPGGLQDDDGAYLAVDADGRLVRSDEGAGVEAVLEAAAALLRAGAAPANEAAPEGAGASDAEADGGSADDDATDDDAADDDATADDAATDDAEATDAEATDAEATDAEAAPPAKTVRIAVDDRDGPLLLSTAVADAAAAWSAATDDLARFELVDEADRIVRYGDLALLGPDAWSLTLAWSLPDGSLRLEALVSPTVGDARRAVLLHELGVSSGLPEGDGGVMAYTVDVAATTPTPADAAAFRAQQRFVPEDLDRNGVVDFYDLEAFGRSYGSEGVNLAADIDGDGRVDDADLQRLIDAYTFTPPREAPPAP
jgi:hypothetical protein